MARIIRCYIEQDLTQASSVILEATSSHHLCRVLRLREGDLLEVFDGQGSAYSARLSLANPRHAEVEILSQVASPLALRCPIYIAMSIIKPDRFDWMVQKSVELGVAGIIPLETQYCSVKINAAQNEKKHEHWRQIMINAAEQCGQNTLPQLEPITPFKIWLDQQTKIEAPCLFLDTQAQQKSPLSTLSQPKQLTLLIGPEGGFHEDERKACHTQGLIPWHLGSRILRAETAAIAGLTLLQEKFGDLQD